MADTYKKIYITAPFTVETKDVPIPEPGPGELLIKTELSGISSGTEMMLYLGTFPNFTLKKWPQWTDYPVCPGYELVGTVVAKGADPNQAPADMKQLDSLQPKSACITNSVNDFEIGDRVITMGEHGEYACLPAEFCHKIPKHVSSEESTLSILGSTAMNAVHRANIEYGDTVAVIGAGILGYMIMQHCKLAGAAKVISIDLDDSRLEVAKNVGADLTLNPKNCNLVEEIEKFNGILADRVIEATGVQGTEQMALDIVRDRGRVVLDGWHTKPIIFEFGDFYFKEVELVASRAGGPESGLPYAYVRWTSELNVKHSLDMIANGKIKADAFKPTMFRPDQIVEAYEMIRNRDPKLGMQAMIKWQ